ncbi:MAG: hypothetical protein J3R72DRAFT_520859 [Linnemannia gamsii]|nr:MAG: hypothetical protein J3R72DRAFT_520859 [Linnemannia gamsii]
MQRLITRLQRTRHPRATISPLDIPEVLERIFSFLDDYSIRCSAVFVCRLWRLLNQNRLVREVTWLDSWKPSRKERALSKLLGAGRFILYHVGPNGYDYIYDAINALNQLDFDYQVQLKNKDRINIVVANNNNNNNRYSINNSAKISSTIYAFTPLRELVLYIGKCDMSFIRMFPFPSSLTALTIQVRFAENGQCRLYSILSKCPLLQHFSLESVNVDALVVSADHLDPNFTRLPLRSLVFINVIIMPFVLGRILPFAPDLKELKLTSIRWDYYSQQFDWIGLFDALRTNNITLDNAHFSTHENRMTTEEADMFWRDVYPQMSTSELSLWTLDITPQLLQTLFSQSDTLTTLEIIWKSAWAFSPEGYCHPPLKEVYRLVHQCLCDSPFLVHLKTLKTVVLLEDLDLFQRRGYIDLDTQQDAIQHDIPQGSSSSPPSILWRCRGLESLHVDIQNQASDPVHSRIIYGYISRVCPRLKNLVVSSPYVIQSTSNVDYTFGITAPQLQLAGGFCLLGRLRYLQRLRVVADQSTMTYPCQKWDLNWMVASGRKSFKYRNKRRREIESWREWRKNEDRLEAMRAHIRREQQLETWRGNLKTGASGDNAIVLGQLKNLGLLLEVEEAVNEMEASNELSRPFPSLESLSFFDPVFLRPEEQLERLFPRNVTTWRSLWTK